MLESSPLAGGAPPKNVTAREGLSLRWSTNGREFDWVSDGGACVFFERVRTRTSTLATYFQSC
jgi:hypothetical protein